MRTYKLGSSTSSEPALDVSTIWVGIDAHAKRLSIAATDNQGNPLLRRTVENRVEHVCALVDDLREWAPERICVTYESGPTGYTLAHWLQELGCEVMLCAASSVLKSSGERIKTDRRDSIKLCEQLRAGFLSPVPVREIGFYAERALLRARGQFVRSASNVKRQVKSRLLFHGIVFEGESTSWTNAFRSWIWSGPSENDDINFVLRKQMELLSSLEDQIKEIDRRLAEVAAREHHVEDVELLSTIPSVGLITAMTILLEEDDYARFDNEREFASYLGLCPGEHSSGERIHRGAIVRRGNKRIRTILVELCWRMKKKDAGLQRVYERVRKRGGSGGKAIVACARRMAIRIRAMLRDRTPYQYEPAT